jgi:class 3 adenylate cyclase
LAKDRALRARGEERVLLAREAAERYDAVYKAFGRYYPGINAATMYLLARDRTRAQELALQILALTADNQVGPARDNDDYWRLASAAEAALVLGDTGRAAIALQRSAQCRPIDLAARAGTRRQLRLVCETTGLDAGLLDALAPPGVVHYCGHRVGGDVDRFPKADEPRVATGVAKALDDANAGFGYGSLASGADIIAAEALLERGAELHLYLPFEATEFVEVSVRPGGDEWVARFHRCIAAASSTTQTGTDAGASPEVLFDYCARVAMGHTLVRAQFLDSTPRQIAVYDGQPGFYAAGTAVDIERWRATGHATTIITPTTEAATRANLEVDPGLTPSARDTDTPPRRVVALLFADFKGYSNLDDQGILAFHIGVMTRVAATLARYEDAILYRNTWGDGLHVVFADVVSASHCALDLQDTISAIGRTETELPMSPQLRIGMHVGPVFALHDPVLDEPGFLGTQITRTARIEPRTPEGSVYVTAQFAALLALEDRTVLACDYVGHIPTAKDYGVLPMYVLHRDA